MSEEEKVYSFGPAKLTTLERLRARFNIGYQIKHMFQHAAEANLTQDDFEKYTARFPEEGKKLEKMYGLGRFTGYGTLAGLLGGVTYVYRITKNPPLLVTGAFLSTVTSYLVSDDIGSWVYGTYKFDKAGTNEKYLKWVHESRKSA